MVVIRDAVEEDIPVIREIAEKTWWPTYKSILTEAQIRYMLDAIYAHDTLLKAMRDGSQTFILLVEGGVPQGFAAYGKRPGEKSVCKLHKIYVLPENHGKGFGKLLIEDVKKRLATEGIKILDLNVNRYNPAKTFYERIGFQTIREEDIPVGPYWMNDYVMRLEF